MHFHETHECSRYYAYYEYISQWVWTIHHRSKGCGKVTTRKLHALASPSRAKSPILGGSGFVLLPGLTPLLVLSVTHGNPSLEEISLSDEQFWPIYPSLAEIPPVTDSTSDVCRDPSLMECTATRYCTVDLLWYQLQRSFSIRPI